MPSMPCKQTLQRELADCIIRCSPLDDIRILLARGAKINEPITQGLTPLHYATYQQYEEAVNLLLVRGCDPNVMDDVGYTALHVSAERGSLHLLRLLLKHKARVCFTELKPDDNAVGNPPRVTLAEEPLRLAIKNSHFECADLLLRSGANPNARYFLGSEINMIGPLNVRFLDLLLRYGADPDCRDSVGLTPLMKACRHPQGYLAAQMLINYGANVNAMTSERHDYRTVLHYAVLSGNLDTVHMIIEFGANVYFPASYQKPTPLEFAILRGNIEMVKLLLSAGADVNTGSPIIGTPLHITLSEKIDNKKAIIQLLLDNCADPNAVAVSKNGPLLKPPLGEYINSCDFPDISIVHLLLRHGARIVLKTQLQHPLGILKTVHRLGLAQDVLDLLLEASEGFSVTSIKRCLLLSEEQKELLLSYASTPITLKRLTRIRLREGLGIGPALMKKITSLPIPESLKRYLLFDTYETSEDEASDAGET